MPKPELVSRLANWVSTRSGDGDFVLVTVRACHSIFGADQGEFFIHSQLANLVAHNMNPMAHNTALGGC